MSIQPLNSDSSASNSSESTEQRHLDALYRRLDDLRQVARRRRGQNLQDVGENPQELSERDSYDQLYNDDIAKYDAAEHNLYFGRLDMESGEIRRVGRIGVLDDDDDYTTLLLDWRAPMSRPFYLATPAQPEDVANRAHVRTRNRVVMEVNTERLLITGDPREDTDASSRGDVANEAALVAALNGARTGHMADIVETIQREQDDIIRSEHRGVLVVQGGPGTGKTAVALHRAAYLLYTHRQTLARSGVLILGPNATFLNYIGQVLPSLGETGVLLSTLGDLYPGVVARVDDSAVAAVAKGGLAMVDVMRDAVRDYQQLPDDEIVVPFEGQTVTVTRKIVSQARGRARSSRRPHNAARGIFVQSAIDALAHQYARAIGTSVVDNTSLLSPEDISDIRDELTEASAVTAALEKLWPTLTPQLVLRQLWESPTRIARIAALLTLPQREALHRAPHRGFSAADAPLLDELAEFIGADDQGDEERADAAWRKQLADAQGALDILTGSAPQDLEDDLDPEILMAYDLIDAGQLAQRQRVRDDRSTADRAKADRTWAYGHIIIDEAQELSPMAWRMVMRRSPNRWMTVVGDTAQTSDPAGTTSWRDVLEPYTAQRWKLRELTVNYRTPQEIMDIATDVLVAIDPALSAPTSIRSSGVAPQTISVFDPDDTAAIVADAVSSAIAEDPGRLVAVIAPTRSVSAFRELAGDHVEVHTVFESKGLEFDHVIVVEPAEIRSQSNRGLADLYVALTRATQRLTVVHAAPLPPELRRLKG